MLDSHSHIDKTSRQIPVAKGSADSWTTTRDLIRAAADNGTDLHLVGSHLDDIATFRAIDDSIVLVGSDANQTASLVEAMLDRPGINYLRTMRLPTPVIYPPGQRFPIGGSRTLRSSERDDVTLLGAGATVHEALAAADTLLEYGIHARVIDAYSVQPLDELTIVEAARETHNVIVAEDHWADGGLGDAVLEALTDADSDARVRRLAVHTTPEPGHGARQLWRSGIDRSWIATAARDLLEQPAARRARAQGRVSGSVLAPPVSRS